MKRHNGLLSQLLWHAGVDEALSRDRYCMTAANPCAEMAVCLHKLSQDTKRALNLLQTL